MLDITEGPVISIINGNTFTMQVTHIGNHNVLNYKSFETIRIKDRVVSSLSTVNGINQKQELSRILTGKKVRCEIIRRDEYNVLIAKVTYYN